MGTKKKNIDFVNVYVVHGWDPNDGRDVCDYGCDGNVIGVFADERMAEETMARWEREDGIHHMECDAHPLRRPSGQ